MRVLIVASKNKECFAPFIIEQAEAVRQQGCEIELFGLQGKGARGYLKNLSGLKLKIDKFRPDVVHAHYGLSGLLACLQRSVPVVITYHGSDINEKNVLRFSKIAMRLSAWNIFVSQRILEIGKPKKYYSLLPCGIDLMDLQLTDKAEARQRMHLQENKKYVLFAGAFDNTVKNAALALESVEILHDANVEILELKGYARDEVVLMMCAADALLLTSFNEGSPQVIKEAMACGCPIVSVDVGDVKERVMGVDGCYVSRSRKPNELAVLLQQALSFEKKTKGRDKIIADGLDNQEIAGKLIDIYRRIC